ncbi:hypothetical protein C0J52_24393 [Blattella germanica]|nr:hypothetical protein C0J52_24393 [Blattella germanica]
MEPDKHSHAKKRKHKKSFIQRAKKHCKKGNHGKGSYLDEDTFQYFLRVLDVVQENNFTNEEDKDLAYNNLTSGLLQSLLFATKASSKKETKKLISQLLDDCFTRVGENSKKEDGVKNKKKISDDPQILAVFENVAAAHLLEAALSVAEKKSLTQIYARCFINQMVLLSKTSSSNFAVQRLLDNCSQKEEFDEMYNEMENHLEEILASGNTGVLLSLATGCRRLVTKQGSFQQSLMKALHCFEPNERQSQLAPLTLRLQTFEQQDSDNIRIHLHGSLILQALLYFNKPIKTVDSIVEMKQADLKKYVALACSKHGSRSLDAIWEAASLKHKCMIMDDLANNSAILNSDQFGSIISSKYNLSLYTHRKEDWKDAQKKENRTKELFADIIGDAKK